MADFKQLSIQAGQVFTPASPINETALFSGREEQLQTVMDAIGQTGQHVVLYGDRGVGKTSLVNVIPSYLKATGASTFCYRINCDVTDTFHSAWKKLFEQISWNESKQTVGIALESKSEVKSVLDWVLEDKIVPNTVRVVLTRLANIGVSVAAIFDELDRLKKSTRTQFADLVKTLSDNGNASTVILVGVAENVEQLVAEHGSIERALVQVKMPPMSPQEIDTIVTGGLGRLGMTIDDEARGTIVALSQGFPHYTHLLSLYASRAALSASSLAIAPANVDKAIEESLKKAQHSLLSAYEKAVRSSRKDSLFGDVLLACALVKKDGDLGYFAAQDIRQPLNTITGKTYNIPSYAQHLNEFSDAKRGKVLLKTGSRRRFRYKFSNPLLQQLVIMRGLKDQRISADILRQG